MRAPLLVSLPLAGTRLLAAAAGLAGLAGLGACSAVTTDPAAETSATPAVQALFGSLSPATPDRLRGVWSITTANSNGEADLRMRFDNGTLTVGTRCAAKADPGHPVLVGNSASIATTDLDGKTGVFELAETINVTESKGGISCSGRIDQATWKFVITGTSLDMDPVGQQGHVHLEKVGD